MIYTFSVHDIATNEELCKYSCGGASIEDAESFVLDWARATYGKKEIKIIGIEDMPA